SSPKATAAAMGFVGVAEMVKLAQVVPGDGTGEDMAEETEQVAEAKPAAAPAVIGGQALSYEQMAGIVLIDGDKGAGTGFMTKIRGVDFVVTNLHVLGRNKKFTLKTLN